MRAKCSGWKGRTMDDCDTLVEIAAAALNAIGVGSNSVAKEVEDE